MKHIDELAIALFEHFKKKYGTNEEHEASFYNGGRTIESARVTSMAYSSVELLAPKTIYLILAPSGPHDHEGLALILTLHAPSKTTCNPFVKGKIFEITMKNKSYAISQRSHACDSLIREITDKLHELSAEL